MNKYADKTSENKSQSVDNSLTKQQSNNESTFQPVNNRPETIVQRKLQEAINNSPRVQQLRALQEMTNNSPQVKQLKLYQAMTDNFISQTAQRKENLEEETLQGKFEYIQKKENNTGLSDNLKYGIENLSGFSMNDAKIHYNSDKPAQLHAHAYAQGANIHLSSGQEKHLPHEAGHVVQQKQGGVKPTTPMKIGVNVNDDTSLEKETVIMGKEALKTNIFNENSFQLKSITPRQIQKMASDTKLLQLKKETELKAGGLNMIGEIHTNYPGKDARAYESKKIKEAIGGYQYFTESQLKVSESDKDFADPIDQRLEQSIANVNNSANELIKSLKGIDLEKVKRVEEKFTQQKDQEKKTDVSSLVEAFAPKIASIDFDLKSVTDEMGLGTETITEEMAEKLSDSDTWAIDKYNQDENYKVNVEKVIDAFFSEKFRLEYQREKQEAVQSDDGALFNLDIAEHKNAKRVLWSVHSFYNSFNGRLPQSLKLYYDLKNSDHVMNTGHFKFDLEAVPEVLTKWGKLDKLVNSFSVELIGDRATNISAVVQESINIIEDLITAVGKGVEGGLSGLSVTNITEKRSIAMHNAANKLYDQKIVWKVGDLHVKDIDQLEQKGGIPPAEYSYVYNENYFPKYIDVEKMKVYKSEDADLGDGYLKADEEITGRIKSADKKLAK